MNHPRRRILLAAAAALGGCTIGGPRPLSRRLPDAEALPLGGEQVLGVLELDGTALGRGGLSGLHVGRDAAGELALTAIGDGGTWATARLVLDEAGAPLRIEAPRRGALHDPHGRSLVAKIDSDAESLARLSDGSWLVGFERWHRIWRYRDLDGLPEPMDPPPGIEDAPFNGGLEALAVLADGRWLALAEQLSARRDEGMRTGWIGQFRDGRVRWDRLAYHPGWGFDPSDLCPLPDGGALVLERRFSLFGGLSGRLSRLSRAALASAAEGSLLEGELLLRLEPPLPTDNWEGVSVVRHGGRLLAVIVSDSNEIPIQRTLLMVVALPA
ncbi:esterase-like activity of phytase family protein [Roseomonas sp. BN140053]|uniref:esterase-like activity of phytase family protein n=1 Tax=Roseomonas sp. BN140053 TaxID=3391898 RepID=UPI0039EB77E9